MRNVNGKQLTSALLCGALLGMPSRVLAQDSTGAEANGAAKTDGASDKNADAKKLEIVEPKVNAGEVRLDGTVTAISSGTLISMDATSYTTPSGKTVEFDKAKSKDVQIGAAADLHERADATKKLAFKDLKLRRRIAVIGKDGGSGKGIMAREIVLWPERDNERESMGVVRVNRETARLMDSGREALQVHDAVTALRFFLRAGEAAQGHSDLPGQALSLDWTGSAYTELEQLDKAVESYTRAIALWNQAGNTASQALSLNNLASVYGRQNDNDKAIEALERASQVLGPRGEKERFVLTWTNLAHAYFGKDPAKAIDAMTQVLSRVRGQTDKSEEVSALSDLAYLNAATGKKDEAQTNLDAALSLLDAAQDKSAKASSFDSLGRAYAYLGQKDNALEYFRRALTAYRDLNDKGGADIAQKNIDRLEKNGGATDAAQGEN